LPAQQGNNTASFETGIFTLGAEINSLDFQPGGPLNAPEPWKMLRLH
jgi:hypothetical protein